MFYNIPLSTDLKLHFNFLVGILKLIQVSFTAVQSN